MTMTITAALISSRSYVGNLFQYCGDPNSWHYVIEDVLSGNRYEQPRTRYNIARHERAWSIAKTAAQLILLDEGYSNDVTDLVWSEDDYFYCNDADTPHKRVRWIIAQIKADYPSS